LRTEELLQSGVDLADRPEPLLELGLECGGVGPPHPPGEQDEVFRVGRGDGQVLSVAVDDPQGIDQGPEEAIAGP
jgi:hypothetical protein